MSTMEYYTATKKIQSPSPEGYYTEERNQPPAKKQLLSTPLSPYLELRPLTWI